MKLTSNEDLNLRLEFYDNNGELVDIADTDEVRVFTTSKNTYISCTLGNGRIYDDRYCRVSSDNLSILSSGVIICKLLKATTNSFYGDNTFNTEYEFFTDIYFNNSITVKKEDEETIEETQKLANELERQINSIQDNIANIKADIQRTLDMSAIDTELESVRATNYAMFQNEQVRKANEEDRVNSEKERKESVQVLTEEEYNKIENPSDKIFYYIYEEE